MKIKLLTYLLLSFLAFTSTLKAQNPVPNPSFENWTDGLPNNWFATNIPGIGEPITQTTPPRSGSLAVRGEVLTFNGQPLVPVIFSFDTSGNGFNINQRYGSFSFYYKFFPLASNSFIANAVLIDNAGNGIGAATIEISNATTNFTQANIPFQYFASGIPSNCIITFGIYDSSAVVAPGSYFVIDDVELSGTVGINQSENPTIQLKNISPNPANNSADIYFNLIKNETVTIELFEVTGKKVMSLLSQELAGENRKEIDFSSITNGFYFLKMITNSGSSAIPVVVQH